MLLYELLTLKRPFDGQSVQDVMERTLSANYDPLPPNISPEMRSLVASLLCDDPNKRPSTRDLLRLPISKLFLDALIGIILTQNTFDEALRSQIREDVRLVRESLAIRETLRQRLTLNPSASQLAGAAGGADPSASNMSAIRNIAHQGGDGRGGAADPARSEITGIFLNQEDIVCEGMLRKLSVDGSWKRRYLCIVHHRSPHQNGGAGGRGHGGGGAGSPHNLVGGSTSSVALAASALTQNPPQDPPERYDLILAVTKEGASEQCIITNFDELEDVFPVPFKYAGPGLQNVFAIAFKSGVKRLTFQASTWEENCAWRTAIQQVLGIDDPNE